MLTKEDLGRLLEYTVWANTRDAGAATRSRRFQARPRLQPRGCPGHPDPHDGRGVDLAGALQGVSPQRGLDESRFAAVVVCATGGRSSSSTAPTGFSRCGNRTPLSCRLPDAGRGRVRSAAVELLQHVANSELPPGPGRRAPAPARRAHGQHDMLFWDRENKQGGAASRPLTPRARGSEVRTQEDPLAQLHEVEAAAIPLRAQRYCGRFLKGGLNC